MYGAQRLGPPALILHPPGGKIVRRGGIAQLVEHATENICA
jgi:hypothetical protein